MNTGVKVGDCMNTNLVTISDSAGLTEAAEKMKKGKVGSLIVTDARGSKYGIITKSDLLFKGFAVNSKLAVKDIISSPLIGIVPDADIAEAAKLMRDSKLKRLVVTEGQKIIGILAEGDIIAVSPALYDLIAEKERFQTETEKN